MRDLSLRHVAVILWIAARLAAAQQSTGTATTAPTTPTTTTPSTPTTGGSSSGTGGRGTVPTSPQNPQPTRPPQPIFVSGNVTLPDGTEPPDRVLIERVCSANRVRPEGYTDAKGRFSLQLGGQQLVGDASEGFFGDPSQNPFGATSSSASSSSTSTLDSLADCELRAKLAGYRSSSILLVGRRSMDNPSVGTLVIFPLSKDAGLSISATSAGAPKDARKALEKGVSEAKKQKFEQAEKELKKAVGLHPKYAEAWTELGKVYVAKKDLEAARAALQQALEADSKYVYPYEELYKIAFEQTNWQELADTTNKLLRLNPYEFPAAYYYNGVANLQLKNLDEAQRSLERALDADKRLSNPKALYVMGLVLIQKREYQGAMDVLADFTRVAPNDSTAPKAKALIDELQKIR